MPFDGRLSPAVEVLAATENLLRSDNLVWTQYPHGLGVPKGGCLLEAMDRARRELGEPTTFDRVAKLLVRAIDRPVSHRCDLNNNMVTRYNDAPDRTLEDIIGVVRKAKTLAIRHEP
jgi:hypothetical protein